MLAPYLDPKEPDIFFGFCPCICGNRNIIGSPKKEGFLGFRWALDCPKPKNTAH